MDLLNQMRGGDGDDDDDAEEEKNADQIKKLFRSGIVL